MLAIIALVVGIGAVFASAIPAQAAVKPIGLSADGITFADDLPASVFAGAVIIPGTSVTRTFWIRNNAADSGNVAVALSGVSSADSTFVSALSLQLTAGTTPGPSVALASANPCASLASGIALASGAVIRVDATLTLSTSLANVTSQNSVGGFTLPVTLTSTDVPAPTGCSIVTPPTGGGGGTATPPHGVPHGQIDTAVVSGAADGSVPETTGGLPDSSGGATGYRVEVIPNTGRFYQEFDVLGWIAAALLGGIVAWRRSRREPEDTYR
jgi:hypothetical protein